MDAMTWEELLRWHVLAIDRFKQMNAHRTKL